MRVFWLSVIGSLFFAPIVNAVPLSDLNVKGFQGGDSFKMKEQRSPFVHSNPSTDEMNPHDLHLVGIAYNDSLSYALISGHILKLGERIGGYRVIDIKPREVVIKRLDESYVLKLGGGL